MSKKITEAVLKSAREDLQEIASEIAALEAKQLKIRNFIADGLHNGDKGAKTVTVGSLKVTVTRSINLSITSADAERLVQEHGELSTEVLGWSPRCKSAIEKHPELAEYYTTKPGPPKIEFKA